MEPRMEVRWRTRETKIRAFLFFPLYIESDSNVCLASQTTRAHCRVWMTKTKRCTSTALMKQTQHVRVINKLDASSSPHPVWMDMATWCHALLWNCVSHIGCSHIQLHWHCWFENSTAALHHAGCIASPVYDSKLIINKVVMRSDHNSCLRVNTYMPTGMTCKWMSRHFGWGCVKVLAALIKDDCKCFILFY